jgi:hypothetical protein
MASTKSKWLRQNQNGFDKMKMALPKSKMASPKSKMALPK